MFHLRLATMWIAAAVLCFGVGTADAIDYVYDFDSGRVNGAASPGIDLPGQDGWYEYNEGYEWQAKVRNDLAGYAGVDGLAACAPVEPGPPTYAGAASRMNDGNFGYSIPAATEFSLEFNALITNSGCWTLFGLAHDVSGNGHVATGDSGPHGETSFRFGYTQINGGHWGIRKADGGDWVTSTDAPSLYDAVWRIVLDVDPAGNDGDGAGSMSVQRLSGENPDTVLTPVASMQDVSLGLSGYVGGGPEDWDAIYVEYGRGGAGDRLMITVGGSPPPIPGDANNDRIVNDQDASILAAHWQLTGMSWGDGDFNGDEIVNDQDASILAAHWQETGEGVAPVPEPGMGILLIGGALALLVFRRRRKPAR